ncbi:acyl-CoA dehydrogenase [Wenzhouxiangella sp. XN24]|uniref:acyl-CoA dehydrogenase n=1 Tax=Wenzhouxiangella sp. XN24 TaxID=2713569 RepID=UPI003211F71A
MATLFWFLLFVGGAIALAYRRVSLGVFTASAGAALLAYTIFGSGGVLWTLLLWVLFAGLVALNVEDFRRERLTRPMLKMYRKMLPSMSRTEREALEAGTVWWEGELFAGVPRWNKLLGAPAPQLSEEEQAFLDGPCEELCRMNDEWQVTHSLQDLAPETWKFLRENGFFAMIIPKHYGGLEFSAYAHSQVLTKVASRSATLASTVAVPNSLGPAELLHKYGTEEQKNRWLPGLADGTEIPCFGLTSPRAGSDAASIPDTGVVCKKTVDGEEVLGLRMNFSKRYITLAPVATVVGVAFRLFDPEGLLGDEKDLGITLALVPAGTPGMEIGRRHLPLSVPFMNGPIEGKDVFVPLDAIIGGPKMAGQGWRMLMECLSVGRCISLPSNANGGAKAGVFATGAYGRIRKQFGMPIGRFEGVQEALARMAGLAYIVDAARSVTIAAVDAGEKPAVPAAILKYHCTEMARVVANDAMDIHGGKAICMGPGNYLGTGYDSIPVMITVEGANILTRSLMIFGQGAIRCHPFVLKEIHAAQDPDREAGLEAFDQALFGHIGYAFSNAARAFVLGLTGARGADSPTRGPTRRYYQHIGRFSAAFALVSDTAMLTLGGALKKKEMLSARLGDILSNLYLASMVLKHFENQGRREADLPLVEWASRFLLYRAQEQLHGFLRNFPVRSVSWLLRFIVFPRGRGFSAPRDRLSRRIVEGVINPGEMRDRLCEGVYRTVEPGNPLGLLQEAMELSIEVAPLEKRVRKGVKEGAITALDFAGQLDEAVAAEILTTEEAARLREADEKVMALIHVDDFAPEDLKPLVQPPKPAAKRRRTTTRRKEPASTVSDDV